MTIPEYAPWVAGALILSYVAVNYILPKDTNFYLTGNPVAVS